MYWLMSWYWERLFASELPLQPIAVSPVMKTFVPEASNSSRTAETRLMTAMSGTCLTASMRKPSRSNVSSHQMASASHCAAPAVLVQSMLGR